LPGGRTAEDELEHHNKEAREKEKILRERAKLREMLRKVRLLYAQRLGYSDRVYCVFHNTTLDDLTIKMPKNRSEMMNVYGMGPKRFQNIGEALLLVIRKYVRDGERAKNLASPGQEIRTNANDGPGADGSSDEEVVMGETWTVEDIVNRKFAEAEAMGLMIMLDDDD
jgi:ATP-dependent DNA helicase RecQ